MKPYNALTLAALALASASAGATTTTNWGALGPVADVAYVTYHTPGAVDDIYTFNLSNTSDVDAYAEEFESRSVGLEDATFTLFSGAVGSGTQVGAPFSFNNTATETLYSSLAAGNYYVELTGNAIGSGAAYDFELFANEPGGGASDAPEPGSTALLLSGLGLFGLMAVRRRQR
jgi:hypothetical protein